MGNVSDAGAYKAVAQPQRPASGCHEQNDAKPSERAPELNELLQYGKSYNCIDGIDSERDRHLPKDGAHLRGTNFLEDLVGLHSQAEKPSHLPFTRAREDCGSDPPARRSLKRCGRGPRIDPNAAPRARGT